MIQYKYVYLNLNFEEKTLIYNKKRVGIYTLGCKVNQYESEAIAETFLARGYEIASAEDSCDIYVINTCTVTAESDRKARQFIRRSRSHNPAAFILVTGCLAQTSAGSIAKIDGVDYICGNGEKLSVADAADKLLEQGRKNSASEIFVSDIDSAPFEKMNICHFDRTRAYIKIEDGCESRCTYCIIPKARGKIRSKAPSDVLCEVNTLIEGGCREIVLTGIETASYGKDLEGCSFADLLCLVDKAQGIGRVRLGSLDPSSINEKFVEKIAPLSSLAPHFHLSLQSGSDRILALMKRRYNSKMAMRAIELLRSAIPNVQFTTDVIVGFPGETEEDFLETLEFCKKARFLKIHIFPYSKREGTPAASMPDQISKDLKRERLQRLLEVEKASRLEILSQAVSETPVYEVLFETYDEKNKTVIGHTKNFFEVSAPSDLPLHSELRHVRLISTDGERCFGEIVL